MDKAPDCLASYGVFREMSYLPTKKLRCHEIETSISSAY